jgi:hypothetical protein
MKNQIQLKIFDYYSGLKNFFDIKAEKLLSCSSLSESEIEKINLKRENFIYQIDKI